MIQFGQLQYKLNKLREILLKNSKFHQTLTNLKKFWKSLKFQTNLKFWENLKILTNLKFWNKFKILNKLEIFKKKFN